MTSWDLTNPISELSFPVSGQALDFEMFEAIVDLPDTIRSFDLTFMSGGSLSATGWMFVDDISAAIIQLRDGDFDNDGDYDCSDVDALVREIAAQTHAAMFDLTGDSLVNGDDLDAWLVEGGANNPAQTHGNPFLKGDANLDGLVDGSDFGLWNANKFTTNAAWCAGDFNADGLVDGSDFGIWNSRKFTSSHSLGTIPEPVTGLLSLVVVAATLLFRTGSKISIVRGGS